MFYEPAKKNHGLPRNPFKALIVPRPIGWISTVSKEGIGNLAPFSYFNALSDDPPYLMISAGCRADGSKKDTVRYAEETGAFVFNLATWELRHQMNETGWIVEPGVDEMIAAGLTAAPSRLVPVPRVAEAPVHMECVYHDTVVLPGSDAHSTHYMLIGRVVGVHIKDEFITADGLVDQVKLRAIARLGYMDYCEVDNLFSMRKRTAADTAAQPPAPRAAE